MENPNGHVDEELPLKKAAEFLGMSRTWLGDLCRAGEIEYIRMGKKKIKIRMSVLRAYKEAHTVEVQS